MLVIVFFELEFEMTSLSLSKHLNARQSPRDRLEQAVIYFFSFKNGSRNERVNEISGGVDSKENNIPSYNERVLCVQPLRALRSRRNVWTTAKGSANTWLSYTSFVSFHVSLLISQSSFVLRRKKISIRAVQQVVDMINLWWYIKVIVDKETAVSTNLNATKGRHTAADFAILIQTARLTCWVMTRSFLHTKVLG